MPDTPPLLSEVLPAVKRCQGPPLLATAHLLLPKGEMLGGHYTLTRERFTWRGFTAPLSESYLAAAQAIQSVVLAGQCDRDRFHNCADDEYEWLTLTPSGAGNVMAGMEAVFGIPAVYFDVEASARLSRFPSIIRRVLLAVQTDRVPSVVSYGPSPLWVTRGPWGFVVAEHPREGKRLHEVPAGAETASSAATAMATLARLRTGADADASVADARLLWGEVLHTETYLNGVKRSLFSTRNFSQLTEPAHIRTLPADVGSGHTN